MSLAPAVTPVAPSALLTPLRAMPDLRHEPSPVFDPWAAYTPLRAGRVTMTCPCPRFQSLMRMSPPAAQLLRPSRARWEELQVTGDQFDSTLACLHARC